MVSQFFLSQSADPIRSGLLGQLSWILLALIVVTFVIFGLRDVMRLSWARISAISSVSFDESIRRRVLWITPLAIIGAIAVSQLQNAVDPQDAIRQTTKFCLFATGLVVVMVAIILASTNLQKEIETRVIYTIVTKPTTRLEIVLGKLWGFAKVSAVILGIMGVFTYGYLHVRQWRLGKEVSATLETLKPTDPSYATLSHYKEAGLLNAKAMVRAEDLQMLGRPPREGEPRVLAGGLGQQFTLHFHFDPDADHERVKEALIAGGHVALVAEIPTTVREPTDSEWETIQQTNIPTVDVQPQSPSADAPATAPTKGPTTTRTRLNSRPTSVISFAFRNRLGEHLLKPEEINKGLPIELKGGTVALPLSPEALDKLFIDGGSFSLLVNALSPAVEYGIGKRPVYFQIFKADGSRGERFDAVEESPPIVGAVGRYGQQMMGGAEGQGSLAVYKFPGVDKGGTEELTFEVKVGIERGGDTIEQMEMLPEVHLRLQDPKTGAASEPVVFRPETNRISYVSVPASAFPAGGPFNVLLRVDTPEKWLGVQQDSVTLATGSRSFAFNLVKSLLILWLMSILVVAIALFCSTFVSWPIAVVLTLVLLFGHWGVNQIGDAGGIGATMTGQTQDPLQARLARTTFDLLSKTLVVVSAFLPDVSMFQATEDIERGISVPLSRIGNAGWVLLGYGAPMVMLAYLILKRKEVAP